MESFHRKLHLSMFWKEVSGHSRQVVKGRPFSQWPGRIKERGPGKQKLGVAEALARKLDV